MTWLFVLALFVLALFVLALFVLAGPMLHFPFQRVGPIVLIGAMLCFATEPLAAELRVSPAAIVLEGPESSQQVLVGQLIAEGQSIDLSRSVRYRVVPPTIAAVDRRGLVRPLIEGRGQLIVQHESTRRVIPIEVRSLKAPRRVSFRYEIMPILTKAGCNASGCHGKAEGQNGFKLSIFGFDPRADHQALAMEGRGRRVSLAIPDRSLLFLKASARMPHGGGQKITPGSYRDRRLLRWIAEGAQLDSVDNETARIVGIEIDPKRQVLLAGQSQQLRVTAIDAGGNRHGVTTEAQYESNAPSIAGADSNGLVLASDIPGEAAILVRYLGHVAVCRVTLPRPGVKFKRPPENNFIDRLVWDKLHRLGIEPSGPADDAVFMRRAHLDCLGTLPTATEARKFLADTKADKRARLIDRLLDRDEYADYAAMRWLDILRADQLKISPQGTVAMQRWLRRSFAENRPFDQFAHELLTTQGNTSAEGPGSFYKILNKPGVAARSISQLLLGVRIECAQCHHHPSERWSQADYVALAGFFTGVSLKKLPNGEQAVVSRGGKDLPHPRSGLAVPTRALGAKPADFTRVVDRRRVLADWMTAADNPFFAKAIANRLWAHYLGRGLIEPIDDIRDTNPASNEPLMRALSEHLRKSRYDLKAFTRTLLNSRVYQLSTTTTASNESDRQNFSHAAFKTLPAEVLLDAICQSTGVGEKFNGWPEGYRAIQVWDNRMPSYFFRIFGRPVRATVCECERSSEPSISQALHLLNAPEIAEKIEHRRGRARQLASSQRSAKEIVDELYLATLSRFPTKQETALMLQAFDEVNADEQNSNRRAAAEDVLWALLNSKEFVFNH
jgi:hypothetical protein